MTQKTQNKQKKTLSVDVNEVKKLFELSAHIADQTEDFLEENGLYNEDFLKGLEQSRDEEKTGKARKVDSLQELMN